MDRQILQNVQCEQNQWVGVVHMVQTETDSSFIVSFWDVDSGFL